LLSLVPRSQVPPVKGGEPSPHEIAPLVTRALEGDVSAFERLVAEYQRKVYTFALALSGDADEAKDLAQDALVKVYRSLRSYRFQSSFSTWLYSVVRNTFLDQRRTRAVRERLLDRVSGRAVMHALEEEIDGSVGAEDSMLREEARRELLTALHLIPEHFREVIVLTDLQGLAYDETARVLSIRIGTVKSRLNRGREALREVLFRRMKEEEKP
jgi:RNA polymerase sigma-70 factor (ECF subfamily)